MRLEIRQFKDVPPKLLFICETEGESQMLDTIASRVKDGDGFIAKVKGEIRLSDGYGEHYLRVEIDEN